MARLDSIVNRFGQRGLADSISTAGASTNRLLLRLDILARDAHALATENRGDLRGHRHEPERGVAAAQQLRRSDVAAPIARPPTA